ncbi:MAG: hypothetical protein PF483_01630, partial [Halothiobacillus sp.]|nr:hypothetical protein [Halothiobacillus sp.]
MNDSGLTMRLDSRGFRDWLSAEFYEQEQKAPRSQSLSEAIQTLGGIARHKGELHPVFLRVGQLGPDYFIDVGDPANSRAIRISAGSWELVDKPPIRFIRTDAMQPLPLPKKSGKIEPLWTVCNVPKDKRVLVLAWLIECWRPDSPFPILELFGEQGSAKSTTQTALRRVIDANACDLRSPPSKVDDLFIGAGVSWLTSYENVSHLSAQLQDGLCILATGGGFARRKLYSDSDEAVINVKRPIVLNGISVCVTAQDLVDRAISIELPTITERQESTVLWEAFDQQAGSVLGGLLDLAAEALRRLPSVTIPADERPRLIEFARLGIAVGQVTGSDFMDAFKASRSDSIARTIDASPVAAALVDWFDARDKRSISETAKNLFLSIERFKPQGAEAWPRSPKGFSDAIRRAAPALRQIGIECRNEGKIGGLVKWKVCEKKLPIPSPASPDVLIHGGNDDDEQDIRTFRTSEHEVFPAETEDDLE